MIRNIMLVLVVASLVLIGGDAFAKCKRINGSSWGDVLPSETCGSDLPFGGCLSGSSIGNLRVDIDVVFNFIALNPDLPDVVIARGDTVLTHKSGDMLFGIDTVSTNLVTGDSADLLMFTGGTGRYAGATGHVVLDAEIDFDNMTFKTRFKGELCTP